MRFIIQVFNPIGDLTVHENVEPPLTCRTLAAAKRRERVRWAGKPAILLADEPTGKPDWRSGEAVMQVLHELHAEGMTLCVVTHDPRHAEHADRTASLIDGRILTDERSGRRPMGAS